MKARKLQNIIRYAVNECPECTVQINGHELLLCGVKFPNISRGWKAMGAKQISDDVWSIDLSATNSAAD